MQAAVLLHFEAHLKNAIAEGSKSEAKGPDVPETPQPTGLADLQALGLFFDVMLTLAAISPSSLHDSMSDFELSLAETMPMTRGQIVVGGSTTSGSGRQFDVQEIHHPTTSHFTQKGTCKPAPCCSCTAFEA